MNWRTMKGPKNIIPKDNDWSDPGVDRKLRLWGVACVRRLVNRLHSLRLQQIINQGLDSAEQFAENEIGLDERVKALDQVENSQHFGVYRDDVVVFHLPSGIQTYTKEQLCRFDAPIIAAARATLTRRGSHDSVSRALTAALNRLQDLNKSDERKAQEGLFQSIFGPPDHVVGSLTPFMDWSEGTPLKMAQTIYEENQWGNMPILGDALEEAGCTNDDVLYDCRTKHHARGSWVVDSILAKPQPFYTTKTRKKR